MGGGNAATRRPSATLDHDHDHDDLDLTTDDHDDAPEGGGHAWGEHPHGTGVRGQGAGAASGTEGHIMARLSTSNLLFTREWKQYYFVIQHGSLVMFKNKAGGQIYPIISYKLT